MLGFEVSDPSTYEKQLDNMAVFMEGKVENLLDKLKENDVPKDDKKLLNWKELSENEQKIKMRDFLQQFKSGMEEAIWVEMSKDVFRNLKII